MKPILEIKNLSHSYDFENINLSDISFSVMPGEFVSILGPSGSGKSTLLRVIAGLERQSSGTIRINGNIVSDHEQHFEPERRNLGLVVQDKSLFPHLNVLENVMFGIKNRSDKNLIARELITLFKVSEHESKYPNELSGGEQQRVALARSLAPDPQILLLDEPFNGLDDTLKNELYKETKNIIQAKGITVLMVSHDKKEIEVFSDKIIALDNGRIKEQNLT
tara:strand:- start:2215 stop:2877 length:663 start_codon:yes stop_codon:yes gene_type:complete